MKGGWSLLWTKEASVLLIWKLDRLSREAADNFRIHKETIRAKALLDSVQDGPLPDTQEARMKLYLAGEIGLSERNAIILPTSCRIQRRIEGGMPLVGKYPLFGYSWVYGEGKR